MKENNKSKFDPCSHIGEIHGIYKIIDVSDEKDKYGHYIYTAECQECGYKKYTHYGEISGDSGRAYTCNHLTVCGDYIQKTKWNNKRIGNIFNGMKQRCYNPNERSYKWYGAKGIKICDEWINSPKSFEEWSLQNGYNDNLTIDRLDEEKDYSPNNCRWIENNQNAKYKSTTSIINIDGEVHSGKDWSKILGLGINTINRYVRKYGVDNTKEFIKKFRNQPIECLGHNQSYYELYMN